MIDLLRLLCGALIGLLRSSTRREAEILVLRHQLNVLKRQAPKRILDLAIPSGLLAIADEVIE